MSQRNVSSIHNMRNSNRHYYGEYISVENYAHVNNTTVVPRSVTNKGNSSNFHLQKKNTGQSHHNQKENYNNENTPSTTSNSEHNRRTNQRNNSIRENIYSTSTLPNIYSKRKESISRALLQTKKGREQEFRNRSIFKK